MQQPSQAPQAPQWQPQGEWELSARPPAHVPGGGDGSRWGASAAVTSHSPAQGGPVMLLCISYRGQAPRVPCPSVLSRQGLWPQTTHVAPFPSPRAPCTIFPVPLTPWQGLAHPGIGWTIWGPLDGAKEVLGGQIPQSVEQGKGRGENQATGNGGHPGPHEVCSSPMATCPQGRVSPRTCPS